MPSRTDNVIVQPGNRDTGPGLVLSLLHLAHPAPDARVVVFPSDHWIGDGKTFLRHVDRAAKDLAVLRADGVAWNDWGTPQSIAHTIARFDRTPPMVEPRRGTHRRNVAGEVGPTFRPATAPAANIHRHER